MVDILLVAFYKRHSYDMHVRPFFYVLKILANPTSVVRIWMDILEGGHYTTLIGQTTLVIRQLAIVCCMLIIAIFCRGMTHLDVSSCALVHGDELCKLLRNHAPNLIALDMFRVQNLTARGVFHLANLAKLQV